MKESALKSVRESLVERRSALRHWLTETPADDRAIALGPSGEPAVVSHLSALDESIAEAEAGRLGLCTVCHDHIDTARLEVDYTASVCLDHLSPKEASHLEREIELARTVQRSFLPHAEPVIPGMEVAAFSRPAQFLGGDYFDFISFASGAHGLVVGDVAGHGVSASLHMAGLQALFRAIAPARESPTEVVEQIHKLFVYNSHYTTFVTMFLAAYSASTRTLRYCNAGHNPPLVLHAGSGPEARLEWLSPTGAAIGLVEAGSFQERSLALQPGDILVMYTDGIVEAANDGEEMYGPQRLADAVLSRQASAAPDIVRAINQSLETFGDGEPRADDTTLVVCRVT